jgi:hypothetical protein
LNDEKLSSVARDYVFHSATWLGGPWKIGLFKRNLNKKEFDRRGKSELFEVAESFIPRSFEALVTRGCGGATALG